MSLNSKVANALIADMAASPDKWTVDKYNAESPDGFSIWIAAGCSFLSVRVEGGGCFGGDMILFGWLVPWRRRLLRAVRDLGARKVLAKLTLPTPPENEETEE